MSNPFAEFGLSDAEFARQIRNSAEVDAGINEFMETEGIPYAQSISPVDHGDYAASWQIIDRARSGKGSFGPTNYKAWWIEMGTGQPGPTDAHATAQKTASHFGGTVEGIGSAANSS